MQTAYASSLLIGLSIVCQIHADHFSGKTTGHHRKPNFILFYIDDFGYGDLASYGHPTQEYGPIDQMAAEGLRFTQFYTPAVFCTPSRASLLTARQPRRSGMIGDNTVLYSFHAGGLPHSEVTLAEALKQQGYATGIVGKWHLGINEHHFQDGKYLPHAHGFDYVGTILPWTLDWPCDNEQRHVPKPRSSICFMYKNDTIIQQPLKLTNLTASFVQDAKAFIYDHNKQPFFLYFPLAQVHTPMFNDPRFKGRSKRGAYGDQVIEASWAVAEILDVVRELKLGNDTLVLFISDHGPHKEICLEGGTTGPLKGGKGNYYEGGIRVPAVAWWPGRIAAGRVTSAVTSTMDVMPTLLDLAGGSLPNDRPIDGKSIKSLLLENNTFSPHEILYFYCNDVLAAVRYKQYKIHFNTMPLQSDKLISKNCEHGGFPKRSVYMATKCEKMKSQNPPVMYNLDHDPGELYPLKTHYYRELLQEVQDKIAKFETTFKRHGNRFLDNSGLVRHLSPCCNPPYCICH